MGNNKYILIVTHDKALDLPGGILIADKYVSLLSLTNYKLQVCLDIEELYELVSQGPKPDLIIWDHVSGFYAETIAMLRKIRQKYKHDQLAILMTVPVDYDNEILRELTNDFIDGFVDPDILRGIIEKLLMP
jgi:response regulator RpfG family c-di-GMP phosphodiesterase